MEDMQMAEYEDVRAAIKRRPNCDVFDVVVTTRSDGKLHRIGFDGPDIIVATMQEGVAIDWEEDSMISFSGGMEEQVSSIFFALAKLFGMSTDADLAYRQGKIEGENAVLWEWVRRSHGDPPLKAKPNPNVATFPPARSNTPYTSSAGLPGG